MGWGEVAQLTPGLRGPVTEPSLCPEHPHPELCRAGPALLHPSLPAFALARTQARYRPADVCRWHRLRGAL